MLDCQYRFLHMEDIYIYIQHSKFVCNILINKIYGHIYTIVYYVACLQYIVNIRLNF